MAKKVVKPNDGCEQSPAIEQVEEAGNQETRVPCEVYSRIVGYLRPVQNWNKGKRQEFAERRTYQVKEKA